MGTRHDTLGDDEDSLAAEEGALQLVYIGSPENGFAEAGRAIDLLERDRVEFVRTSGRRLMAERVDGKLQIGIPLPWVSGRHCELRTHGPGGTRQAQVIDLESRNGTRVSGKTVDRQARVQAGDVLEIGRSFWMLRRTEAPADPRAAIGFTPQDDEEAERGLKALPHPLLPERARTLQRAARSSVPVLVVGPTGGGKRRLAEWMHANSGRPGPFVVLDIGAWPDEEVEQRLATRRGALRDLLASARDGTLCLRGIDGVAHRLQAHVRSLIAEAAHAGDVRLIATATRDLRAAVEVGAFRRELYARLSGFEVRVPPLRERLDRLGVLVRAFYRGATGPELHVTTEAFRYALAYDWPYNVRQLHQALTTAMTIASREGWVGQPVLAEALEQHLPGLASSHPR